MTFEELKNNEKLLIHLTLTDTVLFVKNPRYAKEIDKILDRRCFEANKMAFRKMVNDQTKTELQRDAFIRAKREEYSRDNIIKLLEEKEEWIDVEKYLLTTAYRIKNLLALLEDPKNRDVFPDFDGFLPYRKTFAETAVEVDRLLQGKNVRIDYTATHGEDASGYWDDITQSFVDVHYSSEELSHDINQGAIKRALELDTKVSEQEMEEFFSEVRRVPTTNPEVDQPSLREYVEQMAANNPNIKLLDLGSAPKKQEMNFSSAEGVMAALRDVKASQKEKAEIERKRKDKIISDAISNNGIICVDKEKSKYVAVYKGEEIEIEPWRVTQIRENILNDFEEYVDSLDEEVSAKDAYSVIYKMDLVLQFGLEDNLEFRELLLQASKKILDRGGEDIEFFSHYITNMEDGLAYLRDIITYENAADVTPNAYIKKYGQENGVKRKYDELKIMHLKKMIYLYRHAFLSIDSLVYEGSVPKEMSHKDLFECMDNEVISGDEVVSLILAGAGLDYKDESLKINYIKNLYSLSKSDKKKRNSYVCRKYLEILPKTEVIKMFVQDEELVDAVDLRRCNIQTQDIFLLDRESLVTVLKSGKLPKNIIPSEENILDAYGESIFGKEVLELAESEVISDESILKLYVSRKSVEKTLSNEALTGKDVLDFYSVDRLLKLQKEGKINSKFVVDFTDGVLNSVDKSLREEYIKKMIADLKDIDFKENSESPKYLDKLYGLFEVGLLEKSDIEEEFTEDKIEDLLMDDVIDENTIVKYFNDGLTSKEILKEVFSGKEIEALVISGELKPSAILAITDKNRTDLLGKLLARDVIGNVDLIDLYLEKDDGLSIDELESSLKDRDVKDGELVDLIPDDADEEKISEMFKRYIISQDDLSMLVSRGVITKEKEKELSDYLNSSKEFEKIFGADYRVATLTEVTESGESHTPGLRGEGDPRKKQVKNDPELVRELLKNLGADPRVIYLQGADNSLDGYEVHGIKDLGIMVFGKFDVPGNAIFIMTLGQGSYFLKALERRSASKKQIEKGEDTVLESSATKQELKNTEHVKYRVAARGLGNNIIKSIRELNPEIDEKLKDKKYKAKIDSLVQEIQDDYDIRKEIG